MAALTNFKKSILFVRFNLIDLNVRYDNLYFYKAYDIFGSKICPSLMKRSIESVTLGCGEIVRF